MKPTCGCEPVNVDEAIRVLPLEGAGARVYTRGMYLVRSRHWPWSADWA